MIINEPTLIRVLPGRVYRASCEDQDAILKEPRKGQPVVPPIASRPVKTKDNTASWQTVHKSPIVAGSDDAAWSFYTSVIEVSASSYPFHFNLVKSWEE